MLIISLLLNSSFDIFKFHPSRVLLFCFLRLFWLFVRFQVNGLLRCVLFAVLQLILARFLLFHRVPLDMAVVAAARLFPAALVNLLALLVTQLLLQALVLQAHGPILFHLAQACSFSFLTILEILRFFAIPSSLFSLLFSPLFLF
jgi:hypothetical protein